MNKTQATLYLLLASPFFMATAQAHEPSEHTSKMEKPNCEAMKNMDHAKMDMNDPVMMAMMKKCMNEKPAENHHADDAVKNPAANSNANTADQHDDGHGH